MNKFAYDLPKDLYKGMRVRPSMDMIANSIENDTFKIKYPNRDAAFYLNSPQFLSLLQDTNVGLAEQSKRLEKHKIAEAMARMNDAGGVVSTALDTSYETASSGSIDVDVMQSPELRRRNLEARVRKAREEREKLLREEEAKREQERRDYEYAQFLRQQEEEARRIQAEMAQAAAMASSSHPVATATASTLVPGISDEQLQTMVKGFVAAYNNPLTPPINITYLTPEQRLAQQGIVPRVGPFASTPFRLSEDVMTDSTPAALPVKRPSEDVASPKAKAKPTTVIEEVAEEEAVSPRKHAPNPVKKTGVKQDDEILLRRELKELLNNNKIYPLPELRTKFKDEFPSIKTIISLYGSGKSGSALIDKAARADIIAEYVDGIIKKGKLASTVKGLKEETERRTKAETPASANYPPVGIGGSSK